MNRNMHSSLPKDTVQLMAYNQYTLILYGKMCTTEARCGNETNKTSKLSRLSYPINTVLRGQLFNFILAQEMTGELIMSWCCELAYYLWKSWFTPSLL
jgi:hypothetical protein